MSEKSVRTLRVLVADDNRDAADSCAMLFRLHGHNARVAYSGAEALAAAAEFRPALALLDIGMQDMDGYEVARRIRAAPWGQGMVLAALTGWTQARDKRRSREAGFDHHLAKPVEFEELQKLLASIGF